MKKIELSDYSLKGIRDLPDVPSLASGEMQRKFDELSIDLLIPAHNTLIDELEAPQAAAEIGSAGGTVQSDIDRLEGAVNSKAELSAVLCRDNSAPYTPTDSYNPATKKYVDDTVIAVGAGDMAKAVYDKNNNGIVDSAANGFFNYTHAKVGSEHRLSNADGGDYVCFCATASYTAGDTFKVNDSVCTVRLTSGGNLPTDAFASGSAVLMVKNGDVLTFVGGTAFSGTLALSRGGTGAETAAGARANLGVMAMQVVDNLPATLAANTVYLVY